MRKVVLGGLMGFGAIFLLAVNSYAFDGTVNLTNRVGQDGRCWASAVLMQDQTYKILLSCRDITYPGGNEVFYYVVWDNPATGGSAERLGSLGLGKAEFQTRNEFNSLFITKEKSATPVTPSSSVVMAGSVAPVSILQEAGKDTATTSGITPTGTGATADVVPTPVAQSSSVAKFLTSGILAILGIGGLIFIIFIITKR